MPRSLTPFQFGLRTLLLVFVLLGASLAVFGAWGIVVCALAVGFAVYLQRAKSPVPGAWVATALLCSMCCYECFLPIAAEVMHEAWRRTCADRLKEVWAALRADRQQNACFPPACLADGKGKAMHSWRVLILPQLRGGDFFYKQYSFAEAWDGPKNIRLSAFSPACYLCPTDPARWRNSAETSYVVVVGADTAWTNTSNRVPAVDMASQLSTSVILIELPDSGIIWTEPRDFSLDCVGGHEAEPAALTVKSDHINDDCCVISGGRVNGFFSIFEGRTGVHVVMADGSVRFLRTDTLTLGDLKKVLQIGGCKNGEIGGSLLIDEREVCLNWRNFAAPVVWLSAVGTMVTVAVLRRKARPTSAADIVVQEVPMSGSKQIP